MAIAFDSFSRAADGYNSSLTWSHTCSGSDIYLLVFSKSASNTQKYNGCTYAGNALTELHLGGGAGTYCLYGGLVSAGTANIVLSASTVDQQFDTLAMSFTGVSSAGTPVATATIYQSSPLQTAITIAASAIGVSFVSDSDNKATFVPEAGQTLAYQSDLSLCLIAGGYKPGSGSTVGWTWASGTKSGCHVAVVLQPATSGVTATGSLAYLSLVAPTTSATGAASAAGSLRDVAIVAPTASATGSNIAAGSLASIQLAAPVASATGAASATGSLRVFALIAPTATASGSVAGSGTLTFPLTNNTGTLLAGETGATVHIFTATWTHVVTKTGQTSNGAGVMTVTDAALTAATEYRVVPVLASGDEGMDRVTAA